MGLLDDYALRSHTWIPDEDTNGDMQAYCTRCHRYMQDCLPNDFHGVIVCDKPCQIVDGRCFVSSEPGLACAQACTDTTK